MLSARGVNYEDFIKKDFDMLSLVEKGFTQEEINQLISYQDGLTIDRIDVEK